ncbi:MAG: hypothetical protein Q9160_001238 [Pyrenula sp. 1 TL-2023]
MELLVSLLYALSLFSAVLSAPSRRQAGSSQLPIVDLGYEVHQARSYNQTGDTYSFTNIRYAQPPIGDLRFAAPVAPTGRDETVTDGSTSRICPQASPAWSAIAAAFIPAYLTGRPFDYNATVASLSANQTATPIDPRTDEDCLFLDVYTPRTIFDAAASSNGSTSSGGAPVLVWIYGGGYTAGNKDSYNPAGLISSSNNEIIFVALNYRLGAFGWLSGPTFQSSGGVSNAALYDQRLALEWVQSNIHLFGGDPSRVTVIGESAGGGSIMHQITAFASQQPPPFAQAIPQSPGFLPTPSNLVQETTFTNFLKLLNVSTLAQARALPSSALLAANSAQVLASQPYGTFTYGPVVDGVFTTALPGNALLAGAYPKNLNIMVGHNALEGLLFTSPLLTSSSALQANLQANFPTLQPAVAAYILGTLYPPDFSGAFGYTTDLQRAITIDSEFIFTCNTNYLDRAYGNDTFAYQFSVPPSIHGQDVSYTFFNGAGGVNVQAARVLQKYITNFAVTGDPDGVAGPGGEEGVPPFPKYGEIANQNSINVTGVRTERDPNASPRCRWWESGLYS